MCSIKLGVLKNFSKFRGKHLCQSLFFNKSFNKKEDLTQVLSCEFCVIFMKPFLLKISGWLLLIHRTRVIYTIMNHNDRAQLTVSRDVKVQLKFFNCFVKVLGQQLKLLALKFNSNLRRQCLEVLKLKYFSTFSKHSYTRIYRKALPVM